MASRKSNGARDSEPRSKSRSEPRNESGSEPRNERGSEPRNERGTEPPRGSARSIRIEQQVCFSLHAAARAYDALYRELLAPFGLSYPQYLALIVLGQAGAQSVKELGVALRLDSGTLSPMLKRMEAAGLVTRHRVPADERRVMVALTDEGKVRLADLSGVQLEVARLSGLEIGQLGELMRVLRSTTASLDAHLATT